MRCRLAILLFICVHLCVCRSVNYCGSQMCAHTNSHTFCQYPVGPSARCTGYMGAQLSAEEKARIIARLNRRRHEAARGQLRRMPPAGNMLKLRWVEELAREAQRWADQCRPPTSPEEQDACRDLYSTSVGQCVASVVGEAPGLRVESMIDMWYMQNVLYKGNVTSYIAPTANFSSYSDFAQIVWAHTYMVGCGRSRFMVPRNGRLRSVERLVCNFAPRGPTVGRAVWMPAVPASACPPRSLPDVNIPGLCNYQYNLDESNDIDNTMTLEEHALLNTVLEIEANKVFNYLGSIDELYLTKIAIATMENPSTTLSYYNSMHKRDIMEKIIDNEIMNLNNIVPNNILHQKLNTTSTATFEETASKKYKTKMINLIGRPKSYNIDELNEVDSVVMSANRLDVPDRNLSKIKSQFYGDYEYADNMDIDLEEIESNNITNAISIINDTLEVPINNGVKYIADYSKIPLESVNVNRTTSKNRTLLSQLPEILMVNGTNVSLNPQKVEDYLSDSETVQELQEALDRMEQSMEMSTVTSSKVRRELREPSFQTDVTNDQAISNTYPRPIKKSFTSPPEEMERNKSAVEKAPVLNMLLRYMPYMKPYQQNILGSMTSSANALYLSQFVLIFSVYFC
ncbi:uncharacterized protein LOC113515585 isoform X2 [Galleria mellonella]|uniref:Uncharacterized protein LOC113515585 isoform X2 n=1 Tax=Galleria mellonella TaxID=7137 RepID=A0A6J3C3R9_GALME|nr:uncharacterized protein LOC113515585 isoform X2 [Galleria mellonella]